MCGSTSNNRLRGAGLIHSTEQNKWLAVAEELSELSEAHFKKIILAFQLIHQARQREQIMERPKKPKI